MSSPRVTIVGSFMQDLVFGCAEFPRPGETLRALEVRRNLGGKGANQAVAARRVHDDVVFVGRVGDGAQGGAVRDELAGHHVDVALVRQVPDTATGTAFIQVSAGENRGVVTASERRAFELRMS